jgi:TolA-binding protein
MSTRMSSSMKRSLGWILGAAVASLGSLGWAGAAQAATGNAIGASAGSVGGVCISEEAKQSLVACPNSGPQSFDVGQHGKAPTVAFHSAIGPSGKKEIPQPSFDRGEARDDRKNRLVVRQRALLVSEIAGLEQLLKSTSQNSPDRADLLRRLAEDYVELENAAFHEKTQAEIDRDALKRSNPRAAGQKQATADQDTKLMLAGRAKAEQYYTIIKTEYPTYVHLDEVLYYLAYEYEQGNDYTNARKVYYELIKARPDSKYIPNAYLAFGELFFNEAQGDPSKWDLAAQFYGKVIEYPPPKNTVYGYSWYKVAYVYWNQGQLQKSLSAFKKTIDYGVQWPQQPGALKLADSARRDLIPVYALTGDPTAAYNFFHNLSGDAPGTNDKTYKMMDDLGQNYLDTGHYPEAITLYKDLIHRDTSSGRTCVYQAHIADATLAMKSGNKDAVTSVLDDQVRVYNQVKNSGQSAEAKHACANTTAALVTETALAWHLEAVGSPGQRGTNDPRTMKRAAELYQKVVDTWSAPEFATFEFPKIIKEDWPTIYKIRYEMADLLYVQQDWAKCGPAFDAVVAEDPNGPEAAESAYASVLCYQNIYEAQHKDNSDRKGAGNLPGQASAKLSDDEKLRPKQLTENQKGMITAFNRYICYIKPGPNDTAGQDKLVEVKYARARTYFEAQHWDQAAVAFRDIAMNNPNKEVGIYAAQLYLESVNVMGAHSQPPRPSCFDDMGNDVPKFVDLYCTGANAAKNVDQCTSLAKIQCDIQRLKAQKLVEVADKTPGMGQAEIYEKAGNTYYELWKRYGETPLLAGQPAQCDKLDEILTNAARAFQAGRLIARAIRARSTLLDSRFHMEDTPLAKRAIYDIGGNYQAIAVYDQAADFYERYAAKDKNADRADVALSDAAQLRLGLGQEDLAIKDAALFSKEFGSSKPAQTAAIAFAIGNHYAEKEDWERARATLSGSMSTIDRAAPDIQIQAHAALARSYTHLHGKETMAKGEYARTRGLWSNPDEAVARIKSAYPDEDDTQKTRRIARALTAVGEAYFFAAEEERRAKVEPIRFPEYHGSGSKDEVLKHIKNKVAAWYAKKSAAIKEVEPAYIKILDLKPEPPPKWVIAAGSRAGLMWGDFVDDFRKAPIPDSWKKDADIRGTYYDALDTASEPFKVNGAKPALKKCLDLSVKYQYFDEFSRSCEVWLAKNYKAEYHVVDELRGTPTLANSGLDDKPPPLLVGGAAWHPSVAGTGQGNVAGQLTSNGTAAPTQTKTARPARHHGGH